MRTLADAFERAARRDLVAGSPSAILFSGGLDSSLIAQVLRGNSTVRLRTVGLRGAKDLEAGRTAAGLLELPWTGIELDEQHLERSWNGWGRELHAVSEPRRSVLFSLGLAFASTPGATLWIGQGADELFGGYAHFEGLEPDRAAARAREDLARLRSIDWPKTLALAAEQRVRVRAPYLASDFVDLVEQLPPEVRFPAGERKELLRAVARHLGLPAPIVERPKRAMQYGSGIHAWVRRRTARSIGGTAPRSTRPGADR